MIANDEVFDALGDVERRTLLVGLLRQEPRRVPDLPADSRVMVEANAALLERFLASSREFDDVDKQLVRKYHSHLPKLATYEFIDWDREEGVVRRGPRFDEIRPLLEVIDDGRDERVPKEVVVPVRG